MSDTTPYRETLDRRYTDQSYLAETSVWHDADAQWKADHIFGVAGDLIRNADEIIDVGCGTGGVLCALYAETSENCLLRGYELAPDAFAIAETRARARLSFFNESPLGNSNPVDVALCLDVFEHVSDYIGFLNRLRYTAHNVIFHIPLDISMRSVWNKWPIESRHSVGHLHHFTADTALATLLDAGYEITRVHYTHSIMQPPPKGGRFVRLLPHKWLFSLNPELCAVVFGGCSLIVCAKTNYEVSI